MSANTLSISFVIPVYRSEHALEGVLAEIAELKNIDWEVILVNDNSPDNVDAVIRKLIKRYPKQITYLQVRKNCGQQAAIINGFRYVTKDYIATIDDDGQNPPKEVLSMMTVMLDHDYDVVYGVFKIKKHSVFRNLLSTLNRFVSPVTINNKNRIPMSNVRLLKKSIVDSISQTSSSNNYIDGLIFSLTDHVGFTYVEHRTRVTGTSSYNLIKLNTLWINHMIGYSNIFIKLMTALSFAISVVAFLAGVMYFIITINNETRPTGWLSTYLTLTFLFSFTFLLLAIISEYVSRIYTSTNQNKTQLLTTIYQHT